MKSSASEPGLSAFIIRKFNIRFVQYWCYGRISYFYAICLLFYYKVLEFTRV